MNRGQGRRRILTKEEAKQFSKTWEDIKKVHEATLQ